MRRQKPPIIISDKLVSIFDFGISKLSHILNNLVTYERIGGLSASYLFAYSIFESTLFQIYYKVLKAFPRKVELECKKINRDLLLNTSRTSVIIEYLCNKFSQNFGHDRFSIYIKEFNNVVGIDLKTTKFPVKELDEYKSNRNNIAHRGEISLSLDLVKEHIKSIIDTLSIIKQKFILKYSKYTDIELIKKSCEYVFNMYESEFEKCFIFSQGKVAVNLKSIERFYDRLSHSEKHCFLLYIANYNSGISKKFKVSDLMPKVSLGAETIDRISFINDLFEEYPYLINR